jgi:hypothetical protein
MVRIFVSTYTILITLFNVNAVEESQGKTVFLDGAIVLTNLALVIATVWLIRVTTKEAMENQQATSNALLGIINRMTRNGRARNAKHCKVPTKAEIAKAEKAGDKAGEQ